MLRLLRIVCFVLVIFSGEALAQDFTYSNINLVSVTYSGGNLPIHLDSGSTYYGTPQFSATNQYPVAYVSGTAPTVAASLTIDCATVPDSIYVRGACTDAINLAVKHVPVATSVTTVHSFNYPATIGSHAFTAATVRYFKPFTINWEISFDGVTWKAAGTSNNTMYVTRSTPQVETGQFKYFHTVYDISCRNAQNKSLDTAIIARVWSEFTDNVVLNWKNDSLFYYKIMNSPNVTLGSLLSYRDAECYTFAQLFLACIKIQGVVRTNNYVYITPINNTVCTGDAVNRFIVKNWTFGTPTGGSYCAAFPWKNTYNTATGVIPPPYNQYVFLTSNVTDQIGIPGVCNNRPSSYFNNHQIVKLDGVYYDACYGVTFPTLSSIKTAAFSGWGFRFSVSGTTQCYFTNDMTLSDLSETITTW